MQFPTAKVGMIIKYVKAQIKDRAKRESEEAMYRIYITDSIRAIVTCVFGMAHSKLEWPRYYDMIDDKPPKPQKSAEEIVSDVVNNAGLEVIW